MHQWKPEMIRFMKDASEYSSYFRNLAQRIGQYCSRDTYLCDAGCGLGYLSFELAHTVQRIDAIDKAPQVVDFMKLELKKRRIENVRSLLLRLEDIEPSVRYDVMVFSLSEPLESAVEIARRHGAKTLIVVNKVKHLAKRYRHVSCPGVWYADSGYSNPVSAMVEDGTEYRGEIFSLELGQPLRSLNDARLFFETYRDDVFDGEDDVGLLYSKLEEGGSEAWPYYFPMKRELCMFVIDLEGSHDDAGALCGGTHLGWRSF